MITLRRATPDDKALFIETRLEVLHAVFGEISSDDEAIIQKETWDYLNGDDDHITYFAFDENTFAGCGSVCFYRVLPVCDNLTGSKAFIMNMYTHPHYRRRGIANLILDKLTDEAKARGIRTIHLDASDVGKNLYHQYGFVSSESEMHLPCK